MPTSPRSLAVLALGFAAAAPLGSFAQPPAVHEIRVEARKFEFDPAVIEVTAGERVRLVLHSSDTTHGFEITDLKLNVQLPRSGSLVTAEFTAPPPGRYAIACSEMCGRGHRHMKAALVSLPPH